MPADYFNNVLYPLQDKALEAFRDSPFYLTGGTALSRGYFHHRYSEDLDYFVNDHPDFQRIVEKHVKRLEVVWGEVKIALKDANFCRIFVAEEKLKIEMVNDVPSHIGELVVHPVLGMIDSKENILANKLTAIVDRALPKDIVDIYFLLTHGSDLKKALTDAGSKAAGISPLLIAKILAEYDYSIIDAGITWTTHVQSDVIKEYCDIISGKIVKGTL